MMIEVRPSTVRVCDSGTSNAGRVADFSVNIALLSLKQVKRMLVVLVLVT